MKRRTFSKVIGGLAAAPLVLPEGISAQERPTWSIVADLSECCSCDIPCSCNFGRPERVCHGTRLYQIREGQHEGRDLAGINIVVTFDMRRWTRIYIDDSLTAEQIATAEALIPVALRGFGSQARAIETATLTIDDGGDTFRFSVPESTVEMRLYPGIDGGPITIAGLPNPAYYQYVQYESVVHEHESADGSWSHEGSNGFRSVMRATG